MHVSLAPAHTEAELVLTLRGDVVLDDAAELYDLLRRLARRSSLHGVQVDFGAVDQLDSAGAVAAKLGAEQLQHAGKRCELVRLSEQQREALALVSEAREPLAASPPVPARLDRWYAQLARARVLFDVSEMVVDTLRSGVTAIAHWDRRRLRAVAVQTVLLGADATFIVALLSLLIGVILAFQGAFQLRKFGADVYMAELVSLGMVREFSSVMTAIILAGRSGAALAAELATMSVQDEVDALQTMGISTAQYLVFPRVFGLTIGVPLLTVMSMAIGICAGVAVAGLVGIPPAFAYHRMQAALTLDDFMLGLIKSVLFAWVIGFVGCFVGLSTRGGASSVGRNTTRAVVLSILLIVIIDSVITTTWTVSHGTTRT